MFLKLEVSNGEPVWKTNLFVSTEDDGVRIEEHTAGEPSECIFSHHLTSDQTKELKKFLEVKGF